MNRIQETQTSKERGAAKWAASLNDTQIAVSDPTVAERALRTQGSVPADFVIVRDHNSPNDVIVKRDEIVDLRDGNVFYTIRATEIGERKACTTPPKRAMFVDDRIEEIGTPHQTGGSIRDLFEIPEGVLLFRDLHSPNDQPIERNAAAEFNDGPVFYTRTQKVEISINGKKFFTESGKNSVEHLRTLGGVPANEILSELKNGKFEALKNDGHVRIKGGEVFVSHPASAGSSR